MYNKKIQQDIGLAHEEIQIERDDYKKRGKGSEGGRGGANRPLLKDERRKGRTKGERGGKREGGRERRTKQKRKEGRRGEEDGGRSEETSIERRKEGGTIKE